MGKSAGDSSINQKNDSVENLIYRNLDCDVLPALKVLPSVESPSASGASNDLFNYDVFAGFEHKLLQHQAQ